MQRIVKLKIPEPLKEAEEAFGKLECELDRLFATMEKWPIVKNEVMRWARSITMTNCGWIEYGFAQRILQREEQRFRMQHTKA